MTEQKCSKCVDWDLDSNQGECAICAGYNRWRPIPAPAPEHLAGWTTAAPSALNVQVAGDHYKKMKIQPIEFIHANSIPFAEGCAIKYLTRWRDKGGVADLEKAKHFIELLIELETRK